MHNLHLEPASFIHLLHIHFQWGKREQFPYDRTGLKTANFAGQLNIPMFLDNGCTFSIMPNTFYNRHEVLHKWQQMPVDDIVINTGNVDIWVQFCIVIALYM